MNADEFLKMDPYEEVAQQGQIHPLSPAYVPDPMKLDEHMLVHVSKPKHPEYHAPSDDDIQVEDDDEDPEEDPSEEHEPEDDDEDPEEDPNEDSDETEPFEEDETAVTPPPPRHRRARISVRPQTPMAASTQALIDTFAAGSSPFPLPPTSPAYDQAPLESSAAAARAPRSQYDFVDTIKAGQGLIRCPGHDTRTIAKAFDRAEDVGYVRALQASKHWMMTSIEEVNLRVSYQAQVRRHEKLQEVHQAYLSSEAWNRALLARLEALETHMSRMKWQRQSAEDLAVTQMMRIHTLEARAHTDTVEDASSSCAVLTCWNGHVRTLGHEAVPKTLVETIELANDLMDQKLFTYAERQNENKRKTDDSSRNSQQQQPHKRQNVARAYTAVPGEKKVYTGDLPLCTKCNYHHIGQCAPKCGKCKRYGHSTTDCRFNINNNNNNNNNRNQKAGSCYECRNTGHIKRNCLKLKNRGNGNGNGVAQGRAYALGGRDASPDSNVITGTFLLNNRYAKILFDTGADRSFVSTTFSALINITPTTLENDYDVELADEKIIGVNIIIRGCTLNFMNHLFNIDLMPVPLGSFDVIIEMDWLTKYHGVIICDE
nr:reverse transcriptase domain-containing protein [Tanacetum cinerariifolium]